MLIDNVTLIIRAGNGGNGVATFKRDGMSARGGPDGGNGGRGGDVLVQGDGNLTDLQLFRYKKSLHAEHGGNGTKHNGFGKNAHHLVVEVPLGTKITNLDDGTSVEIERVEKPILLARGGRGGFGNVKFKSATNQTPKKRELGEPGEVKTMQFELRLIADIGLIGLPNAGKSSLLAALTRATPKIASYPFTTLEPNVGMMGKVPIADIPGLIEGASQGVGLGLTFLKHIEKTKILIHCIDISGENPILAYQTVRKEFALYNPKLLEKPEIIFLNKQDLVNKKTTINIKNDFLAFTNRLFVGTTTSSASMKMLKRDILTLLKGANTMQGTIKTKTDRGFGFIARDGETKDLFFHSKDLVGVTYDELQVGDKLEFDVVDGPKGPSAKNVKRV